MKQKGLKDREDAMYDACSLLKNKPEGDHAVIVDEAQDMGPADFALIRALVPISDQGNDIFIVGDPHQRIYGRQVPLSHCGIEVRGRSRKLRLNYRATDETHQWATALLTGLAMDDLDGGSDDLTDYRSLMHGDAPWVQGFDTFPQEVSFIHSQIQRLGQDEVPLSTVCIVVRSNALAKNCESQLKHLGDSRLAPFAAARPITRPYPVFASPPCTGSRGSSSSMSFWRASPKIRCRPSGRC
ncbi:hypothetical protein GFS31_25720 [Leptolyngbya sp. BL0902]|nr:hypothetical protein GFS31_25720 [Leptolyngbya sp. BL0902]